MALLYPRINQKSLTFMKIEDKMILFTNNGNAGFYTLDIAAVVNFLRTKVVIVCAEILVLIDVQFIYIWINNFLN